MNNVREEPDVLVRPLLLLLELVHGGIDVRLRVLILRLAGRRQLSDIHRAEIGLKGTKGTKLRTSALLLLTLLLQRIQRALIGTDQGLTNRNLVVPHGVVRDLHLLRGAQAS